MRIHFLRQMERQDKFLKTDGAGTLSFNQPTTGLYAQTVVSAVH